jgi:peptidyl-prolyl cis-trans isomerase B (cyclophilin B)
MRRRSPLLWASALLAYAFLYLPLAIVVVYSFNDSRLNAEWVGFTLDWYRKLFANVRSSNSLPLGHGTRTELSSKTGQYEDPDPVRPQKSGPAPTPPRQPAKKVRARPNTTAQPANQGGAGELRSAPRPVPVAAPSRPTTTTAPATRVKPPTASETPVPLSNTPNVKPPTASETPVPLSTTPNVKPPTASDKPVTLSTTPNVKPPTNSKEPAKANARSDTPPKSEPYDNATPEEMAGQCVLLTTELGDIEFEVYPEHAPETVRSFLNLTASGYLNQTTFSRVVKGFVIQGGNLATGPNWNTTTAARMARTVPDEPNQIKHERGIVSMARGDQPNSASTNFFILVGSGQHLDGTFAAFGRVRKGLDVVDKINEAPALEEKPEKPVRINQAKVVPCQTAQ